MAIPVTPAAPAAEPPLADRAERLARRVAEPTTADRDRHRRWSADLFAELAAARPGPGLAGPLVPLGLGGGGLSAAQACALLEGLGSGSRDPGLGLTAVVHSVLATMPLRAHGSAAQQQRYLPRMASGEWLGAVSLAQTLGSALDSAVTAEPVEDGWVLEGAVDLVAGGAVAHHYLVVAAHPAGGRTAFIVDRDTPGLSVEAADVEAMPTCPWGRVRLRSCRLPEESVLGAPRRAAAEIEPLLAALDWVFTCAPWVGLMRTLIDDAVEHAREQRLFGRPLSHSQSVRQTLADMATRCELASEMLHRTVAEFDRSERPSHQVAAATRLVATEAVRTVVEGAMRLAGTGTGLSARLVERAHRDASFFAATGGGPEVLRPVIAASVLELG